MIITKTMGVVPCSIMCKGAYANWANTEEGALSREWVLGIVRYFTAQFEATFKYAVLHARVQFTDSSGILSR